LQRSRRQIALILGTLLLAAAGDWGVRNLEMRALLDSMEESESAMNAYNTRADGVVRRFAGLEDPLAVDPAAVERAVFDLQDAASTALATTISTHSQIAAQPILPWHTSIDRARDSYLDHSTAWQEFLGEVVDDPARIGSRTPTISGTFDVLKDTIPDALPPLPWPGLAEQVQRIIAD
jgi:hypothetical protein